MHYIITIIASMPKAVVNINISAKLYIPSPLLAKPITPLLTMSLLVKFIVVTQVYFTNCFGTIYFANSLIFILVVPEQQEHHQVRTQ